MGCCSSCDDGRPCEGDKPGTPPGVLVHGPGPSQLILPGEEHPGANDEIGGVTFLLEPGIPQKVAWRMSVPLQLQSASQAYELGECNALRLSIVVLNRVGAGGVQLLVEGSLDKCNWQTERTLLVTTLGYRSLNLASFDYRLVRLRYSGLGNLILTTSLVGMRRTS